MDLVRLALAGLVLLSHSYEIIDGNRERELLTRVAHTISFGDLAVDFFFALSGYLICKSWEREPVPWSYLRKRLARIYPGFMAASLLSIVIFAPLGAQTLSSYWSELDLARATTGLLLLWKPDTPLIFVGSYYPEINAPLWTIGYEFLCYLALLLLGGLGLLRRRNFVLLLWLMSITAFLFLRASALDAHPTGTIEGHVESAVRFGMLFLGGVCFCKFRFHELRVPFGNYLAGTLLVLGLFSPIFAEPTIAVVGTYLILRIGLTPMLLARTRAIPDLSYGTYLYGWPVQKLVLLALPGSGPLKLFCISGLLALACAALSWRFVESRALLWAHRRSNARADLPQAGACSASVGAFHGRAPPGQYLR